MRKLNKNSIDWLCNRTDALKLLKVIRPREFTVIEAVTLETSDKEEVHASYDRMIQYDDDEAYSKLRLWMSETARKFDHDPGRRYIYFRFKRWN